MAFISIVELKIKPDKIEEAKVALNGILKESRAFDGCISIDVLIDKADPGHWTMYEQWESEQHSTAYSEYRAGPGATTAMAGLVEGPPRPTKYALDPTI